MTVSVKSSRLQDIEAWIKIVENEKGKGMFFKFFNRLAVPWAMFRKTDDWLARLYFDKKQEEERIRFENVRIKMDVPTTVLIVFIIFWSFAMGGD